MLSLLVFKEKLRAFYGKYDIFIIPMVKFAISLTVFIILNTNMGYMSTLKNPIIAIILSLICSVLPYGAIVWVMSAFLIVHVYAVSIEMALIIVVFLLTIGILYYGFHPGDSYILILTPLLFAMKIPYLIPLLVGLGGSVITIIPVGCGVVIYYLIQYVRQNAGVLTNDASVDITQKYVQMINGVLSNKTMLLLIIAFAVTIIVVYIVHNLSIDYAWVIATVSGIVTMLVVVFAGDFIYGVSISIVSLLIGILISGVVSSVYTFFVFTVDYTRTEFTQFEDDDYYYYVKAVPKIAVSAPDIKVQTISSRKTKRNENIKKN